MTELSMDNASQGVVSTEPDVLPDTNAAEPGQVAEAGSPATPEVTPPAEPETKPQAEKPHWATQRLSRYSQKVREREATIAEREARIAELERALNPNGQAPEAPRPHTAADVDRLANERAQQIADARAFDQDCNSIAEAGKSAHPDFMDAIATLNLVGKVTPGLIEAVKEAGDPASLLYQLGKNPDEAERILALTPARMGAALAKLAAKAPTPPPVSRAPAPLTPVAGSARVEADPDKMSMEDYVRWRDAQDAKRK